jgi:uncharacterized MAPEG superfamily protein
MVELIYYAGLFYILHLFLTMGLSLHKVPFMEWSYAGGDTSNMTAISQRMAAASDNLRQSLPIFLAFAILSVITDVDNLFYAQLWLGFRITYLVGAMLNLYQYKMIRAIIWAPSIIVLLGMGSNLVA